MQANTDENGRTSLRGIIDSPLQTDVPISILLGIAIQGGIAVVIILTESWKIRVMNISDLVVTIY